MRSKRAYLLAVLTLVAGLVMGLAGVASAAAIDTLKQPPFPPTDVSLFSPQIYEQAPPLSSPTSGPTDEATLRSQLKALLVKRFGSGSTQVSWGLAKFDAASTKAIVADPRLRAALVALKGTVGEPAINGTLDGTYGEVFFGTPPCPCDPIAQVIKQPDRDRPDIVFNVKHQYEDFRQLAPTMAHEPLHRDAAASGNEESIANSIDVLVYGQMLLEKPRLATSGTHLSRFHNTDLMGRINSRDANGRLRLFLCNDGINIFPGGVPVDCYATLYPPDGQATPGNAVLKGEVRRVVGSGVTLPQTVNFDDNTLLLLDSKQKVFTNAQLVKLATILKLDTSPQSATAQ